MATIYAGNEADAAVIDYTGVMPSAWSSVRNASSGTVSAAGRSLLGMRAQHFAGKGGSNNYGVTRTFFWFDTSSITGTVSAADFSCLGYINTGADVIVVKSTAFGGDGGTSLAGADFNNFDTSTPYSSEYTSWTSGSFNDIALNATARTDIQNNNVLIVCVMEYDHDFQDSAPTGGASNTSGVYLWGGGTSNDAHLEVTVSTGYGNTVIGVAPANIAKVKEVATANIEKVIGV